MSTSPISIGRVTGTGAAININLGWVPDYVRIVNITDADVFDEWFRDGSAAGTSISTAAAVAPRSSNGVTALDTDTAKGFTIGSGISESGKVLGYIAQRNLP